MVNTVVINYQHVERMKLTNETTVYVQFASGTTRIFEFIEPTLPAKMIVAFENWLGQRHQYGGYVVKIGQDGKASGKQCLKRQDDKWIPVSERLPDNWESVLTIDISKSTRDMVTAFYNPETSLWSTHSGDLWVTHWMPLPELPIMYGKVCEE